MRPGSNATITTDDHDMSSNADQNPAASPGDQQSGSSASTDISTSDYVKWFRHSSPYINAHRDRTFVLLLSDNAVAHSNFANIVHDIALLNSLGVKLVIVHGCRAQINARLDRLGLSAQFHQGRRVTDREILECVKDAAGSVRSSIEALLSMGLPNSPMHGADIQVRSGNFITAKPLGVVDGIDFQYSGLVRRVDRHGINTLLEQNNIVLISPLGFSPTGEIFSLVASEVAVQTARALRADKLIMFGPQSGIESPQGELYHELQLSQAKSLLNSTENSFNQQALRVMVSACEGGIPRNHVVSYTADGALLEELFSRDGAGTLVSADSFEQIRIANIDDVGGIISLIEPFEANGTLVKRSRELLENEIDYFTVLQRDGMVIACAGLYLYEDEKIAEVACVVTHVDYQGAGRAARILHHLERRARDAGIERLFVLTTRTAHWFIEQGFRQDDIDALPLAKKTLYNYQRNSKVFIKNL